MEKKTARRWLARNQWTEAALRGQGQGPGSRHKQSFWRHYWDCLALTTILFRRY